MRPLAFKVLRVALLATSAFAAAACQGTEPEATAVSGDTTGWGAGAHRAPLGVEGKPIIETPRGPAIGDEILVKFADGTSVEDMQLAVAAAQGVVIHKAPRTGYHVVRFAGIDAAASGVQILRNFECVIDAGYNHIATGSGPSTSPTIDLAILQWNVYAMGANPLNFRLDADGVVVAVLDTGVAYEDFGPFVQAPDLADVDFLAGWDFINDDAHPNDDQRHGTHVTGVIAASAGISAMAPGAIILPVKVLDGGNSGTELALAEGIMFAADNDAQVINMSLSFPPTYFPSRMLQRAVDHAARKGVVMVAASGNHGEDLVAYPAAFRDVIAVGASALVEDFTVDPGALDDPQDAWDAISDDLERADYSNRGYKIDVLAPGGRIPSDANGDGKPEAVLAQTFALGDPTDFGYYFYAGTSQAAAEVTAIVADMLRENPDLEPNEVRALLMGSAHSLTGSKALDLSSGRGAVRAKKAVDAAGRCDTDEAAPRLFANVSVTLHDQGADVVARARVEVIDADGAPVPSAKVYGMWSGAAFAQVVGTTDAQGMAEFTSGPLSGNLVVGFQVDGVSAGKGAKAIFDRPLGFTRIDALSLELLATFGAGVSTSPTGVSTSPTGATAGEVPSGSGPSTSPTIPLPADPALTPISIAFDPALFAGTNYRPTLLLPNFSWGMATSPMAVAVDEAWFLATFVGAADRRVVSFGRGVGSSPLRFEHDTSFPTPIALPPGGLRIALILLTFTSGVSTSPTGVSTSPTGVSTSPTIIVDPGLTDALALQQLFNAWHATAAGVSTSPTYDGGGTVSADTFAQIDRTANGYFSFAATDVAVPVASYGDALAAAAMPMAPVAPDADGAGQGVIEH